MQADYESRVVCVWAGAYGSGYLIAPSLVLTAGHVAKEANGRVLFAHEDQWWECRRVWWQDGDVDAALLEINDPDWRPRGLEPVRWGQLTGARPVAWDAVGFPDIEPLVGGLRETSQPTGTVSPGTRLRGGRYAGQVTAVPSVSGTGSPWAGLSGAPFFCGELLAGVIIEDPAAWASGRVEALPVMVLAGLPEFRGIVERHAAGPMVLESVELSGFLAQPRYAGTPRSPASLLLADAATVRFRGRKDLLNKLTRWCRGDGVSVRLITGPGGQGKTRFARELASQMQAQNWLAGWLKPSPEERADYRLVRQTREPLLLVIDYAETRADEVVRLLGTLLEGQTAAPVRVLLLARSSGEWWERVKTSTPGIRELTSDAVVDLQPLEINRDGRRKAFAEAAADLAFGLAGIPPFQDSDWRGIAECIQPPEDLGDARYETVLAIHMTALATLLQGATTAQARAEGLIEDILLDHEQAYWERTAAGYGVHLHPRSLQRAVAAAVLTEAPTEADAMAACAAVPGLRDRREDEQLATVLWLHDLYPGASGRYLAGLQPDRLADHLIGKVAASSPDLLGRLLPALTAASARHAFTVLGRAWTRQPILVGQVREAIFMHPDAIAAPAARAASGIQDPAPVADALNAMLDQKGKVSLDLALDLFLAVPPRVRVMAPIAFRIAIPMAAHLRELSDQEPEFQPDYGRILSQICARMWIARMHSEATLAIGEHAVAILRRLADPEDSQGQLDFGEALNTLAIQLMENARHEEALAAAREAVTVYEQGLTATSRARFGLAAALNTVALELRRLGHYDEALASVEKALPIVRLIPLDESNDFPLLAGCLNNRALVLNSMERHQEALKAVDEAIRNQRPWAHMRTDPYALNLAGMILMRGRWQAAAGRTREALECCTESLAILRKVITGSPGEMQPDAAPLLSQTAVMSAAFGNRVLAADAATDEVALTRRLAQAEPDKYRRSLADALAGKAEYLRLTGGLISARLAAAEAMKLARELVDEDRQTHLPRLADALSEAALCYRELEQPYQALPLITEAVEYRRELAADQSTSARDRLARALNQYSNRLAETGRPAEARLAIEEAVAIRRELAEQDPEEYESGLAASLSDLAGHLLHAREDASALTIAEQAIAARRRVNDRRGSTRHKDSDLANLIASRAMALAQMGRYEEALADLSQAIRVHGQPVDGPSQLTFVTMLINKASFLQSSASPQQAMTTIEKAMKEQRKRLPGQTDRNRSQLVQILELRSQILLALNRPAEAVAASREARVRAAKFGRPAGQIDEIAP
jgi:tetratricopeptide (TPR) repeat protein